MTRARAWMCTISSSTGCDTGTGACAGATEAFEKTGSRRHLKAGLWGGEASGSESVGR